LPTFVSIGARAHAKALHAEACVRARPAAGMPIRSRTHQRRARADRPGPFADHRDNIPARSDIWSNISKPNGGVIYAKSNTSGIRAGANTFNEVFAARHRKPVGPVALRRRLLGRRRRRARHRHRAWLAHSTDMGGRTRSTL